MTKRKGKCVPLNNRVLNDLLDGKYDTEKTYWRAELPSQPKHYRSVDPTKTENWRTAPKLKGLLAFSNAQGAVDYNDMALMGQGKITAYKAKRIVDKGYEPMTGRGQFLLKEPKRIMEFKQKCGCTHIKKNRRRTHF